MATKKWLTIVVDGNSDLSPFWPKISSEFLVKIVRAFCDNSRREGAIPSCEFGLIMYNANISGLGYRVQFIKWTTDVEHFLGNLSRLTFNGSNQNQHNIVQGLAEALVMFTRNMRIQEFFNGERHCILVATGDPDPQKMLVSLPTIGEEKFVVGQNFNVLKAHFLEVAKMFHSLRISLSVLTPKKHPMFHTIFNLGNGLVENTPAINYGNGQINVLLSAMFKEAHNVIRNKGVVDSLPNKTVESTKTTSFVSLSSIFSNAPPESQLPISAMPIEGTTMEAAVQNVRQELPSTLPLVNSQATTNVPSPSFTLPINLAHDFLTELNNDIDEYFNPRKKTKTCGITFGKDTLKDLYQPDQRIPLEDTLGQGQTKLLRDITAQNVTNYTTPTIGLTPNSFENVNISIPSLKASTSTSGEGSSKGPAHEPLVNHFPSSKNCSDPNLSFGQNNPNLRLIEPTLSHPSGMNSTIVGLSTAGPSQLGASFGNSTSGMNNTTIGLGTIDPLQHGASLGNFASGMNITAIGFGSNPLQLGASSDNSTSGMNDTTSGSETIDPSMFLNTTENSLYQFQSSSSSASFAVLPCSSGSSEQEFPRHRHYNMSGFNPLGPLANKEVYLQPNHTHFWPCPPSLAEKGNFEPTWEGCLVGKIDSKGPSIFQAKALRKPTSVDTITGNWPSRLHIAIFIPKMAVNHTMGIHGGAIDYMFFEITQLNSNDLFTHLKSNNLCAKIELPKYTLILSTTECKHNYLGTLFPAGTIFVEPLEV